MIPEDARLPGEDPSEVSRLRHEQFESWLAESCAPCAGCQGPTTFLRPEGQRAAYSWCELCDRPGTDTVETLGGMDSPPPGCHPD